MYDVADNQVTNVLFIVNVVSHATLVNEVTVSVIIFIWRGTLQEKGNSCQEVIQPIHLAGLNIRPVTPASWTCPRLPLLTTIPCVHKLLTPKNILTAFGEDDCGIIGVA